MGGWSPSRPALRRMLWYRERLNGGGFTTAEAAAAHEMSERTVFRDMEFSGTLGWEVGFCRRRRRWVLEGGEARLPVVTLPEGEIVALLVAEEALRAYEGTPYAAALERAFAKLGAFLEEPVSLELASGPLPRFTTPPARRVEAEQFRRLAAACRERRRLELVYHSPEKGETTTRTIEPYRLFCHAGDWYLAAYDHLRGGFRTFALGERMREVRETGGRFEPDPAWDFDAYMARGFGLFQSGAVEEVVLRFDRSVAAPEYRLLAALADEQVVHGVERLPVRQGRARHRDPLEFEAPLDGTRQQPRRSRLAGRMGRPLTTGRTTSQCGPAPDSH